MSRFPRITPWRATTLAAFGLAGGLFVTSAHNSGGLDLRASSVTDLDTVVRQERSRADDLTQQIAALNEQIATLSAGVADQGTKKLQADVDKLRAPAGLTELRGPGLTVTLDDTPREEVEGFLDADTTGQLTADDLTVHQQDIQAVVNALWAGGADAIAIQGVRIISTTGIKCVGNTVVLHNVPYSPPYKIEAIGQVSALQQSLNTSDYVNRYLDYSLTYDLGWDVTESDDLTVPAYQGSLDLEYAVPGTAPDGGPRS